MEGGVLGGMDGNHANWWYSARDALVRGHWILLAWLVTGVAVFLLDVKLFKWQIDNDNQRYLLSAIAQSLAALVAIAGAGVLTAIQILANKYGSQMVARIVMRRPVVIWAASVSVLTIILALTALSFVPKASAESPDDFSMAAAATLVLIVLATISVAAVIHSVAICASHIAPEVLMRAIVDEAAKVKPSKLLSDHEIAQRFKYYMFEISQLASKSEVAERTEYLLSGAAHIAGIYSGNPAECAGLIDRFWECCCATYAERSPAYRLMNPLASEAALKPFMERTPLLIHDYIIEANSQSVSEDVSLVWNTAERCLAPCLRAIIQVRKDPCAVWDEYYPLARDRLWQAGQLLRDANDEPKIVWYSSLGYIQDMGCVCIAAVVQSFFWEDHTQLHGMLQRAASLIESVAAYAQKIGYQVRDDYCLLAGAYQLGSGLVLARRRELSPVTVMSISQAWLLQAPDVQSLSDSELDSLHYLGYTLARLWPGTENTPVCNVKSLVDDPSYEDPQLPFMIMNESWFATTPHTGGFSLWYKRKKAEWWPIYLSEYWRLEIQLRKLAMQFGVQAELLDRLSYWANKMPPPTSQQAGDWESADFEL